ncbi:BaiN/RdsA family NAD(P)/FAD-dependent oxidoreductase [Bizionia myxarmorum]|uniref:NAD(P)/FAD-dependent oxidoreductase n=1 Tax=Bizionia myxarmorum TaxID=291186 RepID=A0A5D0RDM6_9FLAO|nr:NAD(P)/FAD-dependent oxidoreductase [Bizionia myxarmorum]TYB79119.1 NAD(P)/FAD-dependent oxidoreductase [Bizionia myxarmorum]
MRKQQVIIIGGGAAGFFAAINMAEQNPSLSITILEKAKEGLQKVRISGGGRCNVTHAEFIPSELTQNYPRGEKELLGPFHQFMTGDTIEWFEKRGVELKIEDDGRMFPVSNTSQTIIDCFLNEAKGIKVQYSQNVANIDVKENSEGFIISTKDGTYHADKLLIATGSSVKFWKLLEGLGHTVVQPVPSLFTFDIQDERIQDIPGVVALDVSITVLDTDLYSVGPLLITHVGMSAPSILKLSAFGALELAKRDYKFQIEINFIKQTPEDCMERLKELKQKLAKKTVYKLAHFDLPKRLWRKLVLAAEISETDRWGDLNRQQLDNLVSQLTKAIFQVTGKSTFKDEFVTAGGVDLKEINFKTFESKIHKNLYFAGEVLNIDAVTGGFNFQNAWTGGFIAAKSISS